MKQKLNLGCGREIKRGYLNVDIVKLKGVDKVLDANKVPYPFKDNYFDEILVHSVMEHLDIDLDILMKELYRIIKKKGKLIVIVPHYTNSSAYCTQHKKVFSARTFDGYISGDEFNRCYDFAFSKIKKKILFVKGLTSIYNVIIEKIANINIGKYYENLPLSAFPAKRIDFFITK